MKSKMLALVAVASVAIAQKPASVSFSPLPPFDQSNLVAPDGLAHAFFEVSSGQIVVALPSDPLLPANSNSRIVRFDVGNRVNPTISWVIAPASKGGFLYSYSISDDPRSQQRTSRISMLVPEHDATLSTEFSSSWHFSLESTEFPDRTATVAMARMKLAVWEDPNADTGKIGALRIVLRSQYAPGFCEVFAEGQVSAPATSEALSLLPPSAANDVRRGIAPGIGSVSRSAICPLFRYDTTQLVVASNYYLGLQRLIRNGQLDPSSGYVQSLMGYFGAYLSAHGTPLLLPAELHPMSTTEHEIQNALVLAIR